MLTKIGALLCTSLLGIELAIVPASAQSSSKPFVVFVNGSGDCCAGAMWNVKQRLEGQGATIWTTSYASFRDGSTTNKAPVVNLSTDMDNAFIFEAAQVLNSVPKSTHIILIGHSYGGDSILKVLPFIQRRVQLVVTIDPVGTGGFRQVATSRRVPSNVDYFMNRWEENGLEGRNIVPFDSRTDGSIPCSAGVCDQKSQNLARNADGSEIRVSCGAEEVTCDGWTLPGCNFGGCWKGSNGTKARRMFHNDMPIDDSIQRTVGDKIQEQLAAFRPPINYEDLTRQLYRQILGREPDPSGFNDNVNAMRQHGFEWVRAGMAGSQESRNNINNLYRQYLCRNADSGGMDHHINLLASGQMALDQIRNGIANGAEAQQHKNGCR